MPVRIVRAIHPQLEERRCTQASARRATLLGERVEARVTLCSYTVRPNLVYEEDSRVELAEPGWELVVESVGPRLCRYHEGPRGDPLRQKWCHAIATRGSWCPRHASSPLAVYERCTAGNDMSACRTVDALWPDEEYIVYIVYHGSGFKIGVTRAWRFYTRILEQPHLGAAILAKLRSAVEARLLEKKLASAKGFNEGIGVPRSLRIRSSMLARLSEEDIAKRLAEAIASLGLEGDYTGVRLEVPGCPYKPLLSPLPRLEPGSYRYLCTWGGIIVLGKGPEAIGVKREAIQHRMLTTR